MTSPAPRLAALPPGAAASLTRLLGDSPVAAVSLGAQHGTGHYRLTLADGRQAFAKIQDHTGNEAARPSAACAVLAL